MREKIFYLSFTSILLVQTLQVGYSSAKPYLKKQYKLETSFLALMDCFISFSIATGFFFRFKFLGSGHPIRTLRLNGVMMCLFYICIPLIPLMHQKYTNNVEAMLLGSCIAYGFLFSFFWPCLRSEFHKYYTREADECMYTCWTSARNLGRVVGFVFMTITKEWTWQVSLIVLTILNIIQINALYYFMVTKEVQLLRAEGIREAQEHGMIPNDRAITLAQFWQFTKDCFMKAEIRYFIIICGLIKAVNDNFIAWLPTYLFSHNFQELAGQVTLAFVIPIVTGSFVIGKLYEHAADEYETFFHSIIFLVTTSMISMGGLILLSIMNMNYIQFIMVIFVEGTVVGGFFNIIDQQRKIIADFDAKQNQMHWTLCRGFNSFMTGVVNWIISVMMGIRQKNKQQHIQVSIFYVLLVVSVLGLLVLIFWIRSIYSMFERQEEEERQSQSIDV